MDLDDQQSAILNVMDDIVELRKQVPFMKMPYSVRKRFEAALQDAVDECLGAVTLLGHDGY